MPALLTLADARTALWKYGSEVPLVTATTTQKADFAAKLNQVVEELLSRGKPRTTMRRVRIPVYGGMITLPRELLSCIGVKLIEPGSDADEECGSPLSIYGSFHEFHNGPCPACMCSGGVYPLSQQAQTFRDPEAGFTLRIKGTGTDGTVTLIGGTDAAGADYYSSVTLTLSGGVANNARVYSTLPQIQKAVSTAKVELYSVKSGVETLLAVYAPGETVPAYMRYQVDATNSTATAVMALCKLAFVPVVADTDIVYPSVVRALKSGLKAVQREDKEEPDAATKWWNLAQDALENDREQIDGHTVQEFQVANGVSFGQFAGVI